MLSECRGVKVCDRSSDLRGWKALLRMREMIPDGRSGARWAVFVAGNASVEADARERTFEGAEGAARAVEERLRAG